MWDMRHEFQQRTLALGHLPAHQDPRPCVFLTGSLHTHVIRKDKT